MNFSVIMCRGMLEKTNFAMPDFETEKSQFRQSFKFGIFGDKNVKTQSRKVLVPSASLRLGILLKLMSVFIL